VAAAGRLSRGAAWRAVADGVEVCIKAQPRSRRPGLGGLVCSADGPRLKLAVSAAPEDGRANRAICDLLAAALHVAPSQVAVVQGATSREKTCRIAGDPAQLSKALEFLA
jgi:uncharacterized protein (TIGR00251 family)